MKKRSESTQARSNVISVRLDDASIEIIDLLVQSGLSQSRSEAAAHLIAIGVRSADDLIEQAKNLAANLQRIKQEMMSAIEQKDVPKVKELLDEQPHLVNMKTDTGDTPLLKSVYFGAHDLTELFLGNGAELSLFEAAAVGKIERIREWLHEHPESINDYSHDGWTALHLAAFFGHREAVELLLDHGADITKLSTNAMGNTALHAALAARRTDAAELLIERGADHTAIDSAGWRPLHHAAANGEYEIAERLLQLGADPHITNNKNETPLDLATQRGQQEIINLLRKNGAMT